EVGSTFDWSHLEVVAVGPSNEQLTATINDVTGASASVAATASGEWTVVARSVSRAGKRSLDGDAGTVTVELVGLTGAIDAVQASADGKSTIYYSPTEPDAPEGGFSNGDLWFDTSEEGNNTASVWDGNGWVSMEDARLATIIAAQEALESDLTDVQTSVDGKNTITWNPAAPTLATPGKTVGDMWYRTSGNDIIGYWKWTGSAWVAQMLSTTVIPKIDIGAGTFGSLSGARLQVGTMYADSIVSGLSQNIVPDPGFANAAISAKRLSSANTYGASLSIANGELVVDTSAGITASPNISLAATNDLYAWGAYPGMPVVARVSARVDGVGTLRINIRYKTRDGSTSYVVMPPSVHPLTADWTTYVSSYTLPQEAVGFSIVLQ